jgi:O-antigen ligase
METYSADPVRSFNVGGADSAAALSRCLAFLIPLIVGVYWPIYAANESVAILILRPAVFGVSILLALLWNKPPVSWAESRLAGTLAAVCLILLAPALTATIVSRALTDWVKFVVLCLISLLVCRALRHEPTARAFGVSLIVAGVLAGVLIVFTYVRLMGVVMPTYESARGFKGIAQQANVPLNAVPFAAIFAYMSGMCLIRPGRALWLLGAVLLIVSTVLTGSRAPMAIMLASAFALLILNGMLSSRLPVRVLAWFSVIGVVTLVAFKLHGVTFKQMSDVTEGRWDLWSVAWRKFLERPVLGYGFESWRDDMVSRLPGDYAMTSQIAISIAGGFHNEYLTMLAEQGLIGFIAIISFFALLLRCSWKLAFRTSATWRNGQWALFGCLFLMLRAGVEAPGLFGYFQEPADYLAFLFVAIVLSRFSVEEDCLRATRRAALAHLPAVTPRAEPRRFEPTCAGV